MTTPTITVDMDKRCNRCGKWGASESGLCLGCVNEVIRKRRKGRDILDALREAASTAAAHPHPKARKA